MFLKDFVTSPFRGNLSNKVIIRSIYVEKDLMLQWILIPMKRKYFGTNGIRGEINVLFTPTFVSKMSAAIAASFKNKGTMIIGSDGRTSSPSIKHGVIASFLASGFEVIDVGIVPTPLVQFAVNNLKAELGIVVTASHNPPEFNGIKVIDSDGIEIDLEKQKKIEEIYEEERFSLVSWDKNQKVTELDLNNEYIDQICGLVDRDSIEKKKLCAVVDAGNAVGGIITPLLLRKLGVKTITINGQIDGRFPGRGVEPSIEKLKVMSSSTVISKANFSVAHDGDADRAIFGDETGRVFYGDISIALFQKFILKDKKNKKFVTPISSSLIISDIADEIGGEVIWTPVGCIFVSRKMIQEKSLLGGEENGGLFFAPHQSVRDGPMAAALMAEIISQSDISLSELANELPKYHQKKDKIKCPNSIKKKVMDFVTENIQENVEILTIDGVKLIYPDSWILIRPSGTEPIFRIFAEAKSAEEANAMLEKGLKIVKKAIRNVQ
jgi:phosphomannomutase/phosphoglucomutase